MIANKEEVMVLKEAGRRLAVILNEVAKDVHPGVSVLALNEKTETLIRKGNDIPAFLNYQPDGIPKPYPATLCIAINDTVVHGIPTEKHTVLQEGDIIGLDTGLIHKGLIVDSGLTVPVGTIDAKAKRLLEVTKEALFVGISEAKVGNTVGDIGHAIEEFVRPYGYGIVRELCGHGVGREIHEEPSIPNYGKRGSGAILTENMVIAIEPMLNEGDAEVIFEDDGYTVRTKDGSRSAHFEHTLIVTKDGPKILTKI